MSVCANASPTVAASASAAPVSGWRRMLADSLLVSATTIGCQAMGVAISLLLRFALDPAQMGVWQGLKLFLNYANYANLGVSKGAARELTVALGRGESAAASRGLNLAFTVNTLSSLVYAALLAGVAWWIGAAAGGIWQNVWSMGLLALAVLVVIQRHVTFHVTILRCRQAFAVASQLSLFEAAATLTVAAGAAWLWGLNGLYAGTFLVMLGAWSYLRWRGAEPLAWAWDRREIVRLIGLGGPMLLAGAAAALFQSIDKLMILLCSSDREYELGCYSLSLLASGQLYGLANMLSLTMGPRYGESFGRSGDHRHVALLAARASELQACALSLLAGLGMVAAVPVLGRLFPAYRLGAAPALWLIPGAVAMGLSLPASQCLTAVYRERWTLGAALVGLALAAAGSYAALASGCGLVGVAIATSTAYFAYFVLSVAISLWREIDQPARRRYVTAMLLTLAPVIGLAAALEAVWPGAECSLPMVAAKGASVCAVWSAVALVGWRWGGWQLIWREERRR